MDHRIESINGAGRPMPLWVKSGVPQKKRSAIRATSKKAHLETFCDAQLTDQSLSAFSHGFGNPSEVAFFPKCIVWVHVSVSSLDHGWRCWCKLMVGMPECPSKCRNAGLQKRTFAAHQPASALGQ